MTTSEPTDEQIKSARIIALVDENCDCWSVVVYPPGASLDQRQDGDHILRISIDSSKLGVIES